MNQLESPDQLRRDPALLMPELSVLWFIKLVRFGNFILYFPNILPIEILVKKDVKNFLRQGIELFSEIKGFLSRIFK